MDQHVHGGIDIRPAANGCVGRIAEAVQRDGTHTPDQSGDRQPQCARIDIVIRRRGDGDISDVGRYCGTADERLNCVVHHIRGGGNARPHSEAQGQDARICINR